MELSISSQLAAISPIIIVSLGAFLILLVGVFSAPPTAQNMTAALRAETGREQAEWSAKLGIRLADLSVAVLVAALAAFAFLVWPHSYGVGGISVFNDTIIVDRFANFLTILILAGALLSILLGRSSLVRDGIETPGEYYSLFLMAIAGALALVSAAELVTFIIALEVMSMALYCLCGAALLNRRSSESALKYFLLGSFSAAFLMYGAALIYGATGSLQIAVIADRLVESESSLALLGVGLMLLGLVFKIGLVPFHFWVPDVYQGAPTPLTAMMACVVKCAAIGAAMRVLWTGFGDLIPFWSAAVWYLAFFTMIVGNLVALRQRSVKRMLAYSSIAHAGYIAVALIVPADQLGGGSAILFYLVAYTAMTLGAFGVLIGLGLSQDSQDKSQTASASEDISRLYGISKTHPFLAAMMALFMLSLAGIPPGVAGLFGKIFIFGAAIRADYIGLTVVGVLSSVVAAYYYLRVIVAMYFMDGYMGTGHAEPSQAQGLNNPVPGALVAVLVICAFVVIAAGVFPTLVISQAEIAMQSLSWPGTGTMLAVAR